MWRSRIFGFPYGRERMQRMALAMLHVIINEKLYDAPFVEQWTYGFERLADHIQKCTPKWAEPITGLPVRQIENLARMYATTKPARIDHGNGLEHAPSSNNAVRAIAIMMAITKRTEDGIVLVNQNKCTGCRSCATACPFGVPQYGRKGSMQKCNLCLDRLEQGKQPSCVMTCPGEALKFGLIEDLARFAATHSGERLAAATAPSFFISGKLTGSAFLSFFNSGK